LIPRLRTERLLLREWLESDRAPYAALNADPNVMRFMSRPLDRAESDAMIDRIGSRWEADGHGLWAVERLEDSCFIGFVGLTPPSFEAHFTPAVEIGWRLAGSAWGHGYASEAARSAVAWGFEHLGLREIVSFTTPANVRSRAVMERLGMTHDPADEFDHPNLPPGHPIRRHVLYRLPRDAWEAPRAGLARPPQG
jgi:ribosomal-protein-alanine N-acetyltransferase